MYLYLEDGYMILGFKQAIGSQDAFHYAKIEGVDRKFIRVVLGAALPVLDRVLGAVVVIAETYRPSGPASWTAIGAKSGTWPEIENSMAQFRMDYKFTHVIVDREEARKVIWGMRGLQYGINEIPLVSYAAPSYALTEIGRSYVQQAWRAEGRLVIPEEVKRELEYEPQMGALALQSAACWLKEFPAYYAPLRERPRGHGRILGVEGLE